MDNVLLTLYVEGQLSLYSSRQPAKQTDQFSLMKRQYHIQSRPNQFALPGRFASDGQSMLEAMDLRNFCLSHFNCYVFLTLELPVLRRLLALRVPRVFGSLRGLCCDRMTPC